MEARSNFQSEATDYLGVPYVWGGDSLDEGGLDCSGYVYRVLRNMGSDIPRLTAQGYYNATHADLGHEISLNSCRTGDLLFFGTSTKKITHIAFYYQNGMMIESGGGGSANTAKNPGVGVRIRSIRSDLVACRAVRYGKDNTAVSSGGDKMQFEVGLLKKSMVNEKKADALLFQEIMKARGLYDGELDWQYGPKCEKACKAYQKQRNTETGNKNFLTVDGQCGENTWKDLLGLPFS